MGVWYSTPEDLRCAPGGDGMRARRPLRGAGGGSARRRPASTRPTSRCFYATPGRHDLFHQRPAMVGLQAFRLEHRRRVGLRRSWGRALKTREPSLSIPCFAERRYGGVLDDEMLMALPPEHLAKRHRRHGGARQERAALPVPAIRHPAGRARRHGGRATRPGILTGAACATAARRRCCRHLTVVERRRWS